MTRSNLRLAIAVTLTAALSACAAQSITQDYTLTAEAREGVVTGSVSYSGRYSGYYVHYRQLPGGVRGEFSFGSSVAVVPDKGDFSEPGLRGSVFAKALPPGEYEVYRWSVGSGYATVASTEPFSIRFTVEPGKLVYLGNFHFIKTSSLGLTVTGAKLSYKEEIASDLPIFKRKFPALADTPVAYAAAAGTARDDLGGASETHMTTRVFIPVRR